MDVLLNELAFQRVILNSIDDTVQNREAAEEEVRAEIRALEKQIRALKRGTTTASNSQPAGSSQFSQNQTSSTPKKAEQASGSAASAAPAKAMDGYLSKSFSLSLYASHATRRTSVHPVPVRSDLFLSDDSFTQTLTSWQVENGTISRRRPLPRTLQTPWAIS
jgi:hypothetical protein